MKKTWGKRTGDGEGGLVEESLKWREGERGKREREKKKVEMKGRKNETRGKRE